MSNLDRLPQFGRGLFLEIDEPHNPQPILEESASAYLFGPGGQAKGGERGGEGRQVISEPVYGFWVGKGGGIVVCGLPTRV